MGYLKQVRKLPAGLHNDILAGFSVYRPYSGNLLPNLKEINWIASEEDSLSQVLAFVCPSLEVLRLDITDVDGAVPLDTILKGLRSRSIQLETLELSLDLCTEVEDVGDLLSTFFGQQNSLRSVGLPYFYAHTVVKQLQRLPNLESIYVTCFQQGIPDETHWSFQQGTFEKLSSFGFSHWSLELASRVFDAYTPTHLTSVHVGTINAEAGCGEVTTFLEALTSTCPGLERLSLNLIHYSDTVIALQAEDKITFASLHPLLRCSRLKALDIVENVLFNLKEEDVEVMFRAWPRLERLHLPVEPVTDLEVEEIPDELGVPLSILKIFARHSPVTFQHLGLFFKVISDDLLHPGYLPLRGLRTLSVGTSRIRAEDRNVVSAFLAGVCQPGLKIETQRDHVCESLWNALTRSEEKSRGIWEGIDEQVGQIHRFQGPARLRLEVAEAQLARMSSIG